MPQSRLGICLEFSHEDVMCWRVLELVAHEGVSPYDRVGGSEGGLDAGASVAPDAGTSDLGCHMSHRKQCHDGWEVELGTPRSTAKVMKQHCRASRAVLMACVDVQSSWHLPLIRYGLGAPSLGNILPRGSIWSWQFRWVRVQVWRPSSCAQACVGGQAVL